MGVPRRSGEDPGTSNVAQYRVDIACDANMNELATSESPDVQPISHSSQCGAIPLGVRDQAVVEMINQLAVKSPCAQSEGLS